jgi:hypothetical protein
MVIFRIRSLAKVAADEEMPNTCQPANRRPPSTSFRIRMQELALVATPSAD